MKKIFLLLPLAGAMLLFCGCDRQTKLNTEKIEIMSQRMVQLQESQAKQMAVFQTQLTALAPMMDKMNNIYFEKTHDDALFFHTNTLYLLLTIENKIESQLQAADDGRAADGVLAYAYHTNELDMIHSCVTQLEDAMTAQENWLRDNLASQEKLIEDSVNSQTRLAVTNLGDELLKQIKLSAPDATETARLKEMESDVTQIRHDLDAIEAQLARMTNAPASRNGNAAIQAP